MNQVIMFCMSAGALVGGMDRILGNRFALDEKFEAAFPLRLHCRRRGT